MLETSENCLGFCNEYRNFVYFLFSPRDLCVCKYQHIDAIIIIQFKNLTTSYSTMR